MPNCLAISEWDFLNQGEQDFIASKQQFPTE